MIDADERSEFTARLRGDFSDTLGEDLCSSTSFLPTTTIIVAHPDNETIGAGGQLPRLRGAVVVHAYEGKHPDHDATAFAVHASCSLLKRQHLQPPVVIEMASCYTEDGSLASSEFLSLEGRPEIMVNLSEEQRELKQRMIGCFYTQRKILKTVSLDSERFRRSPEYDFTRPPHPGRLCYEDSDWGMDGDDWRMFAGASLEALGLMRCDTDIHYEPGSSVRLN